jgi:hypothetical protein
MLILLQPLMMSALAKLLSSVSWSPSVRSLFCRGVRAETKAG